MQSTKRSYSQFRIWGWNGKNNFQATGKAIQLLLHGIQFGAIGTQSYNECRETSINFAWYNQIKCLPFFLLGTLFRNCLECFMIFVLTRNEFLLLHLTVFHLMSCLAILEWKAFLIKPTICAIEVTKEINCKHNVKYLNFYFHTISFFQSSTSEQF